MNIVLLATAWGPRFGGINSFNYDLCRGLVQSRRVGDQIFCAALDPSDPDMVVAAECGVRIIALNGKTRTDRFEPDWIDEVRAHLRTEHATDRVDVWVGHDVISGAAAEHGAEVTGSKFALIMHMDFRAYQFFKTGNAAETVKKVDEQDRLFSNSNAILFAVGPLLRQACLRISGREPTMLVPGFPEDYPAFRPFDTTVEAICVGRLDRRSDRIKQGRLAATCFASAVRRSLAQGSRAFADARLSLLGVAEDEVEEIVKTVNAGRSYVNVLPLGYDADRASALSYLSRVNLAFMLSWHEGFGLVGWEAIGAEIPLILSRRSGLYQLIDEELQGEGLGCVTALDVDIFPDVDGETSHGEAIRSAVELAILQTGNKLKRARDDARSLKRQLVLRLHCTWRKTGETFLSALPDAAGVSGIRCSLDLSTEPSPAHRNGRLSGSFDVDVFPTRPGISAAMRERVRSWISPRLQPNASSVRVARPRMQQTVEDIRRHLLQQRDRLFVLWGEPFNGKKTTVAALLAGLPRSADGSHELPLTDVRGDRTCLPVFAEVCDGVGYNTISGKVLSFLENGIVAENLPSREPQMTFEDRLERIRELAASAPAFYVLTDVNVLDGHYARKAIRDEGVRRLVEILADHPDTRIVLTCQTNPTNREYLAGRRLALAKFLEVPSPTISSVRHHVPESMQETFLSGTARSRSSPPISGAAFSAALARIKIHRSLHRDDPDFYRTLGEELSSARPTEILRSLFDELPAFVRGRTAAGLNSPGQLELAIQWAVLLLAASLDGMVESSLSALLRVALTVGSPVPEEALTPLVAAAVGLVTSMSDIFEGRFIIARTAAVDVAEALPDEDPNGPVTFLDMPESMRRTLLLSFVDTSNGAGDGDVTWAPRLRLAFGLIARRARQRAHARRLSTTGVFGRRQSDLARDVQAYQALLASLNPDTIGTYEPNRDEPLDLSEAEIFNQTSRDAPDPSWYVKAIRFAWLCVFRRDIDRNYRLSTIFEDDQLRLDLLLTLFVGVGHLFWKDGEAGRTASLPTLPDHLRRAFKPRELCRLLTSIAISAHRCQRGRIVGDAVRLAEGLAEAGRDGAEPLDPLLLIRLHCAEIDTAVLAGVYEPDGSPRRNGLFSVIDRVDDLLKRYERESERVPRSASSLSAIQRLVVRRGELSHVTGDRIEAERFFQRAEQLEKQISILLPTRGGSLSGRGARRYIRHLLRERQPDYIQVRNLLDLNLARLGRYVGGDRVGCLLDEARFYYCRSRDERLAEHASSNMKTALHYADLAEQRLTAAGITPATQLDIYSVTAAIRIRAAVTASRDESRKLLVQAKRNIDRLKALSSFFGFAPHHAYAELLEGRARIVGYSYLFYVGSELDDAAEALFDAGRAIDRLGYLVRASEIASLKREVSRLKATPD